MDMSNVVTFNRKLHTVYAQEEGPRHCF